MGALAEPLLPRDGSAGSAPSSGVAAAAWKHSTTFLWHAARPRGARDTLLLLLVLVLLISAKLLNIALPLVMRHIVNTLSDGDGAESDGPTAAELVCAYCALAAATEALVQVQEAAWGRVFYKITQRVSLALFEHLHALSMRWHLHRKTGEVLARTPISRGVALTPALALALVLALALALALAPGAIRCCRRSTRAWAAWATCCRSPPSRSAPRC